MPRPLCPAEMTDDSVVRAIGKGQHRRAALATLSLRNQRRNLHMQWLRGKVN